MSKSGFGSTTMEEGFSCAAAFCASASAETV
jgi:hypothetical protein